MEIPVFASATEEQKTFEIMVEPDTDQLVSSVFEELLRCALMHSRKGTLKMSNVCIVFDGRVFYLIATCNKISQVDHAREKLQKNVKEIGYDVVLKSHAKVQDVKLFTKASQCRFGWDSKIATKEDVEEAIKKEDYGKLLTIMPEAADLINRDDLEHLPVLFDMLKQTKAITDCAHEFFPSKSNLSDSESEEEKIQGELCTMCRKGDAKFTRCTSCKSVFCYQCAFSIRKGENKEQAALKAYKEVTTRIHSWKFQLGERCDNCPRPSFNACACGQTLCSDCCLLRGMHPYIWFSYGEGPLLVHEYTQMPKEENLHG